jgi:hypothetical protein
LLSLEICVSNLKAFPNLQWALKLAQEKGERESRIGMFASKKAGLINNKEKFNQPTLKYVWFTSLM